MLQNSLYLTLSKKIARKRKKIIALFYNEIETEI
jgi:hypothetical protein